MAMRIAIWKLVLCLVVVVLASPVLGANAQSEPRLEIIPTSGETTITIKVDEEGAAKPVPIAIRNASSYEGDLTISLAAQSVSEATPVAGSAGASVTAGPNAGSISIEPFTVVETSLDFKTTDLESGTIKGTLVVSGSGETAPVSATFPVVITKGDPKTEWSKVTAQPSPVNLVVTNYVPAGLADETNKGIARGLGGILLVVAVLFLAAPGGPLYHPAKSQSLLERVGRWVPYVVPLFFGVALFAAADLGPSDRTRNGESATVRLTDIQSTDNGADANGLMSDVRLSSSTGKTATVQLHVDSQNDDYTQATVHLENSSGVGSFEGSMPVSSSTEATKITTKLLVRDSILWVLIAATFGVWLGWLVNIVPEQRRARKLVESKGSEALKTFEKALEKRKDSPFKDILGNVEDVKTRLNELVSEAKVAETQEALDEQTKAILDLNSRIGTFTELCRIGTEFEHQVHSVERSLAFVGDDILKSHDLLNRSKQLLETTEPPLGKHRPEPTGQPTLTDADSFDTRIAEIGEASVQLSELMRCAAMTEIARTHFQKLSNIPELNPDTLLRARIATATDEKSIAGLLDEVTENLHAILQKIDSAREELERYESDSAVNPDSRWISSFADTVNLSSVEEASLASLEEQAAAARTTLHSHGINLEEFSLGDLVSSGDALHELSPDDREEALQEARVVQQSTTLAIDLFRKKLNAQPSPPNLLQPVIPNLPPPDRILNQIRAWDYVSSAASILLVLLAWVLTQYKEDKPFGTWIEYAVTITTAAALATVLNSVVLPWARSYKLKDASPAKDSAAGVSGAGD